VLFVVEKSFLYDESRGEGGGGHDRRLQRALQHPAVPVGVRLDQRQVRCETRSELAVGALVVDDRTAHLSCRARLDTHRQRPRHARGSTMLEQQRNENAE